MAEQFTAMFRRRPNEGWFRVGRFDVTTTDALCALAVFTVFVYGILGSDTWWRLPFQSFLVREELDVWRLLTWPVATPPRAWPLLGVVFFWIFGQQLEALFGRVRFLLWVLTITVGTGLIVTVLGAISTEIDRTNVGQYGLTTLFLCGIWVFAGTYPQAKWFDVVPLWAVAGVFTLLNVLQYNGDGLTGMVVFELVAIAVGLVAGRSLGLATGWPIPHVPLGDLGAGRPARSKSRQSSPGRRGAAGRTPPNRGTVVDGPWQAPPPPPRDTADDKATQAELDALLDKISQSGLESLSAAEKRRLNELSKRLRG